MFLNIYKSIHCSYIEILSSISILFFVLKNHFRTLKKAELHLKVVKDAFGHTQTIYDKIKSQVDAQPKDDGTLLEKRRELQREVDIAKRAFGQQVRFIQYVALCVVRTLLPKHLVSHV